MRAIVLEAAEDALDGVAQRAFHAGRADRCHLARGGVGLGGVQDAKDVAAPHLPQVGL